MVEETTLSKIIQMNSGFSSCPGNVFFASRKCFGVKDHQCLPRRHELNDLQGCRKLKSDCSTQDGRFIIVATIAGLLGAVALVALIVAFAMARKAKK